MVSRKVQQHCPKTYKNAEEVIGLYYDDVMATAVDLPWRRSFQPSRGLSWESCDITEAKMDCGYDVNAGTTTETIRGK